MLEGVKEKLRSLMAPDRNTQEVHRFGNRFRDPLAVSKRCRKRYVRQRMAKASRRANR